MRRIANTRHGIVAVLISMAVAVVTAVEPLAAMASQGSPGGF
jgi:hypothetical protein